MNISINLAKSAFILWYVLCIMSIDHATAQTNENEYYIVSVSPDETMMAALSTDQTLQILDSQTGDLLYTLEGLEVLSMAVAWRHDSQQIGAASFDGSIRIWCTDRNANPSCVPGALVEQIDVGGFLRALSWNNAEQIASGAEMEGDSFWVWDSNNNFNLVNKDIADVYKISAHPTENKFAVATLEDITILAQPFDFNLYTSRFTRIPDSFAGWTSVAWDDTGNLLAGGMEDGKIYVMNPTTGEFTAEFDGHTSIVHSLAWSPNSHKLASSELTGEIIVWDVTSGEAYRTHNDKEVTANLQIDWTETTGLIFASDTGIVGLGPNTPPIANADNDQTVIDADMNGIQNVVLNASASTDDVVIVDYVWHENGVEIASGIAPQISLSTGVHTFTLTVTDDDGATHTDQIIITVASPTATYTPIPPTLTLVPPTLTPW